MDDTLGWSASCPVDAAIGAPVPPKETNQVMLDLSRSKHELPFLDPPESFKITVADIPTPGPFQQHIDAVHI